MEKWRLLLRLTGIVSVLVGAGCEDVPADPVTLAVYQAGSQPDSPSRGTVVVVQGHGGTYLAVHTRGGNHSTWPQTADHGDSCVPINDDQPIYFLVVADDVEALFYVDLVASEDREDADSDGPCKLKPGHVPKASRIIPITTRRTNPPDTGGDVQFDSGSEVADAEKLSDTAPANDSETPDTSPGADAEIGDGSDAEVTP